VETDVTPDTMSVPIEPGVETEATPDTMSVPIEDV
jgi:hypothetical protein